MIDKSDVSTAEFPVPVTEEGIRTPRPFSSNVHLDVAAASHPGNVRDNNEDHYLVARGGRQLETLLTNLPDGDVPSQFDEIGYILIVADGMGGMAGGELASRMAISTLINVVLHVPDWIMRLDEKHAQELMERAGEYYQQVNEVLTEKAQSNPRLKGMGTTMTATYSVADDLFVAHVGDSRAYLFRDGKLQLLTRDQTHAQMLADAGIIRQEEVSTHRLRHVLSNALGGLSNDVKAEIQRLKLCDGDRLLLCTDGLTDMVEEDAISAILRDETASDDACTVLINRALENGGKDNVTAVLARYSIPEASS